MERFIRAVVLCVFRGAFPGALLAAFLGAGCALHQPTVPPQAPTLGSEQSLEELKRSVSQFTLSNGFQVLLVPRPETPVFTGQVWVKVGGVDEDTGSTGIAHFLEHMAFKGTREIGTRDYAREQALLDELEALIAKSPDQSEVLQSPRAKEIARELEGLWIDNEFSRIYERQGENGLNAGTGKDYTFYTVELPKNAFELWCWMESERFLHPVFRQFYKEREVVQEERRTGYDDNPGGRLYELLLETAFTKHPYRFSTIGRSEDLKKITATQMRAFAERYYRPDNSVLVLVGDLNPAAAQVILERYFGRIPRVNSPIPKVEIEEPTQTEERQAMLSWDAEPMFMLGYHKPTAPHPDDALFSLLHDLLAGQRSSFLVRELVLRKQLASSIATGEVPGNRYPQLFAVEAVPRAGVSNERLRDEVQHYLEQFAATPIPPDVLEGAKRRVKKSLLDQMATNFGLAMTLGGNQMVRNDWRSLFELYRFIQEAKEEDVRALIPRYLTVSKRTFVHLEKKSQQQGRDGRGRR